MIPRIFDAPPVFDAGLPAVPLRFLRFRLVLFVDLILALAAWSVVIGLWVEEFR